MTEQQIIETLATKVMGWEIVHHYGQIARKLDKWTNGIQHLQIWNPLQNIADAWQIVERFKNEQDGILKAKFAVAVPVLIYKIEPVHICQAALKAIEAAEEQTIKEAYPNHFS